MNEITVSKIQIICWCGNKTEMDCCGSFVDLLATGTLCADGFKSDFIIVQGDII